MSACICASAAYPYVFHVFIFMMFYACLFEPNVDIPAESHAESDANRGDKIPFQRLTLSLHPFLILYLPHLTHSPAPEHMHKLAVTADSRFVSVGHHSSVGQD